MLPWFQNYLTDHYPAISRVDRIVLALAPLSAFAVFALSTTYHVVSNHTPPVSTVALLFDFTGILVQTLVSYITGVRVAFYCEPRVHTLCTLLITVLIASAALLILHPRLQGPVYRPLRTMAFLLVGLTGLAPVAHMLVQAGWHVAAEHHGLHWWLGEAFWYLVGTCFFASRIPERWWGLPAKAPNPEKRSATSPAAIARTRFVDIFGASHQLFHVCVVLAAACHCGGV